MPRKTKYNEMARRDYVILRGEAVETIAKDYALGSLDEVGADCDDFRDVHCETLRGALCAAHDAGVSFAEDALLAKLRVLTAFAATHTGNGATPEEGRLLDAYGEGVQHAVDAARAAIARAEGRAP